MKNKGNHIEFTDEQVALIKSQIAPKATDDELKLFLYQCTRTGLGPLARQIYCIHRKEGGNSGKEKMSIQTSIDGFRLVAERTGNYGGQGKPEFQYDKNGAPIKCTIVVYKFKGSNRYEAAVGEAHFSEYAQLKNEYHNGQPTGRKVPTDMWATKPHIMLGKVTEALALRKAFPQELSGLYTTDEMANADDKQDHSAAPQQAQLPAGTSVPFNPQYTNAPQAQPVAAAQQQTAQQPAQQQQAQPQQTPFNKKYTDANAIVAVVKTATKEDDFRILYHFNKELIEGNDAIKNTIVAQRGFIANQGKVIATDNQLAQVCARINKGDLDAYKNAIGAFVLSQTQREQLDQVHQQALLLEQNLGLKYENPEDIATIIGLCQSEKQVMKLHQNNSMIIDRTPDLQTKINARLKVLKAAA